MTGPGTFDESIKNTKGKWVMMEAIAKGGMREVYRAHQLNFKLDVPSRQIPVKPLTDMEETPARMLAQVRHRSVLHIFGYRY